MPDFFEMQTEYLASLNIIYSDLDASLIAMVLTSQLYKNPVKDTNSKEKVSMKYFYQKKNFCLPASSFKIKEISSTLNLGVSQINTPFVALVDQDDLLHPAAIFCLNQQYPFFLL